MPKYVAVILTKRLQTIVAPKRGDQHTVCASIAGTTDTAIMNGQLASPMSMAHTASLDEGQPQKKKSRAATGNGDASDGPAIGLLEHAQEKKPQVYVREVTEESMAADHEEIRALLTESRISSDEAETNHCSGSADQCANPRLDRGRAESDLRVWGYMLSLHDKELSFLLSKESRCGSKRDLCKLQQKGDKASGVVLKDYNGDNLASSGYVIGSAEECDVRVHGYHTSPRHFVLFKINQTRPAAQEEYEQTGRTKTTRHLVYLQEISGHGTFVNGQLCKRNETVLLQDNDLVSIGSQGPSWYFRMTECTGNQSFDERFQVLKTLGKGHFAEVFEAVDRATNNKYAAKMIKKRMVNDDKAFLHEIGLLMSCTHPLITCIRDVFDDGHVIYLVLELAQGGELFDRIIQRGKFTEKETRFVFQQLFSALEYLHASSIVHRDIKPENILLCNADSFDIRLADFGLAKIIGRRSITSSLAGTPSYIPPEMLVTPISNRGVEYTRKVDSWSAGVVLYICLCGFPPFSQELAPPDMKTQIREGRYQFTRPYWDSISDGAIDLVSKLLTVDVEKRLSISEAAQHPWMLMEEDKAAEAKAQSIRVPEAKRGVKRQRTMIKDLGRKQVIENGLASPEHSSIELRD
jgi:serine/threonine-protein kinase Chk2